MKDYQIPTVPALNVRDLIKEGRTIEVIETRPSGVASVALTIIEELKGDIVTVRYSDRPYRLSVMERREVENYLLDERVELKATGIKASLSMKSDR